MFRKDRRTFVNKQDIDQQQSKYVRTADIRRWDKDKSDSGTCRTLKSAYIKNCDKSLIISSIDTFYDTNWYTEYSQLISEIRDYKETKALLIRMREFQAIFKITEAIDSGVSLRLERDVVECIEKRIEYKYRCMRKEARNAGHDAEILRHVFHHEKLKELKALFIQIDKKHLELKKEISETRLREDAIRREQDAIRREQDALRREQDALEIEVSQLRVGSDDTSAGWNTVITRKKPSRKKHK